MSPRFRLVFFAPPSAVPACKTAIFSAGTSQFRPGDAANPHIGKVGELETTEEVRVEALCASEDIARKAVEALKK
ncbi:structural toxin protein RtxA [Aspergillus nomiae NRRL 13137]|uniref:ATP phosphoribosyltransferase n=1 Tax=Aspergillus nomiae NRRL (strain ATCC 15546 / NRRL 13137 / CBS 260.88 / M93) TaxID=1509407 RepID=A0A0L1J0C2_ASPN3|nr:structural toxin protein RtxA [Aspergillus nomiae NRRL 13137]KNG85100.1 structural toxin protein RtxA [Aspergillus nomiae NRRL 13137]